MVVKFESCVQHSATLMRPVFQIQKQFLVLIILDSTTFDLLKNFFLISILNISVFLPPFWWFFFSSLSLPLCEYFPKVFFSSLCLSYPLIFFQLQYYGLSAKHFPAGGVIILYLTSGSLHVLLFLPKRISPYTNVYLFFKFQYNGAFFLMELGTSPKYYRAACASFYNRP